MCYIPVNGPECVRQSHQLPGVHLENPPYLDYQSTEINSEALSRKLELIYKRSCSK